MKALLAAVGAVVVAGGIFAIGQGIEQARIAEENELRDRANAMACETYMEYSFVNFKDDMTRKDYEENFKALQILTVLGGDPEYMNLLNTIVREYELLLAGRDGDPIFAMLDLNMWCDPYLNQE
jgi:hypothetical protein